MGAVRRQDAEQALRQGPGALDRRAREAPQQDDESIIRRHLRPAFGSVQIREVGTERIDRYVLDRTHLDKKTVHNQLTLLGSPNAVGSSAARLRLASARVLLVVHDDLAPYLERSRSAGSRPRRPPYKGKDALGGHDRVGGTGATGC